VPGLEVVIGVVQHQQALDHGPGQESQGREARLPSQDRDPAWNPSETKPTRSRGTVTLPTV
jgi:hypothetical protein